LALRTPRNPRSERPFPNLPNLAFWQNSRSLFFFFSISFFFFSNAQAAIVAAAADELGDSSGSADGSPAREETPGRKRASDTGGAKGSSDTGGENTAVGVAGKSSGEAQRVSAADKNKTFVADASDDESDDAGETIETELGPNGKPKLPRPKGIAPCPRCESEETKFCYYNNYNIKQPRYFCRGCQRYWTAGGMLRNVPVGAGRRKHKNGAADLDANAAGLILAGVADGGRHPLGGLARAAAAAVGGTTRDRRGGSSDGSATEAEGDPEFARGTAAAVSAACDFASRWPVGFGTTRPSQGGGSSGVGSADGGAAGPGTTGNGMDFSAMFGAGAQAYANPFFAAQAQAAAAQAAQNQARAHPGHPGWPGMPSASDMAFAQMAQMAQARHAASVAAASGDGGHTQAQQQQHAAQAYAAAQTFAAVRGGFNPFFPQPGASQAPNGTSLHKPTASAFSTMPSRLQTQLSSTSAASVMPGAPGAQPDASETATGAAKATCPVAPAPVAQPAPAGFGYRPPDGVVANPNWAAMLSVMAPAMAAMQQYQAAPGSGGTTNSAMSSVSTAAAAAATAGFNPHQMQQIAAALASGGYNPFACAGGAANGAPAAPAIGAKPTSNAAEPQEPDSDASRENSAPPSTGPPRVFAKGEYRVAGEDGAKRFKVAEERAGHAG
jgi:hypothetical protein